MSSEVDVAEETTRLEDGVAGAHRSSLLISKLPKSITPGVFFGLPRSSKARSCRLLLREVERECEALSEEENCCGMTGVAEGAGKAMLND